MVLGLVLGLGLGLGLVLVLGLGLGLVMVLVLVLELVRACTPSRAPARTMSCRRAGSPRALRRSEVCQLRWLRGAPGRWHTSCAVRALGYEPARRHTVVLPGGAARCIPGRKGGGEGGGPGERGLA